MSTGTHLALSLNGWNPVVCVVDKIIAPHLEISYILYCRPTFWCSYCFIFGIVLKVTWKPFGLVTEQCWSGLCLFFPFLNPTHIYCFFHTMQSATTSYMAKAKLLSKNRQVYIQSNRDLVVSNCFRLGSVDIISDLIKPDPWTAILMFSKLVFSFFQRWLLKLDRACKEWIWRTLEKLSLSVV